MDVKKHLRHRPVARGAGKKLLAAPAKKQMQHHRLVGGIGGVSVAFPIPVFCVQFDTSLDRGTVFE
jgi:hypothetical protein